MTNEQIDLIHEPFNEAEKVIRNVRSMFNEQMRCDDPDYPAYRLLLRVQFHINVNRLNAIRSEMGLA